MSVRNAIYQIHLAGVPLNEISRQLHVSRNTVWAVVRQQGAMPRTVRKDKIQIDPDLLRRLYRECDGWMQRVHEKLLEEEGLKDTTLAHHLRHIKAACRWGAKLGLMAKAPAVEMPKRAKG